MLVYIEEEEKSDDNKKWKNEKEKRDFKLLLCLSSLLLLLLIKYSLKYKIVYLTSHIWCMFRQVRQLGCWWHVKHVT